MFSALAAWLVWDSGHHQRHGALAWWLIHVLLIVAWNYLFFEMNRSGWAWMEITGLLGVTVFCTLSFRRISTAASLAMLPTLAWLAFLWLFPFCLDHQRRLVQFDPGLMTDRGKSLCRTAQPQPPAWGCAVRELPPNQSSPAQ